MNAAKKGQTIGLRVGLVVGLLLLLTGVGVWLVLNRPWEEPVPTMSEGIALLEQYKYGESYAIFTRLARRFPDWEAAHVNRGIAAMNLRGSDNEYLPIAEAAFDAAIRINANSVHSWIAKGILLDHQAHFEEAEKSLRRASEIDPNDPHILYFLGSVLDELGKHDEALKKLERVIALQPSFASALYRLRGVYVKTKKRRKAEAVVAAFQSINQTGISIKAGNIYGEGGKYYLAIRNTAPPGLKPGATQVRRPALKFNPAQRVTGPLIVRRSLRDLPQPPALAFGDVTGDQSLELVICGDSAGAGKPGVSIYRRDADGSYSLLQRLATDAVLAAIGDVQVPLGVGPVGARDLVLAGEGSLELYVNDGAGKFTAIQTNLAGVDLSGRPVRMVLVDADRDWDLDVVGVRETEKDGRVVSRLQILNNNRDQSFLDVAKKAKIDGLNFPVGDMVVTDLDGDLDADILVIDAATGKSVVFANDLLWRYRRLEDGLPSVGGGGVIQAVTGDWDNDGDADLVILAADGLHFWRNEGQLKFTAAAKFGQTWGGTTAATLCLADFDGDMMLELLLLGARAPGTNATRDVLIDTPATIHGEAHEIQGLAQSTIPAAGSASAAFVLMSPQASPELVIADTTTGTRSHSLATKLRWIAIDLVGASKSSKEVTVARSNPGGVGAIVEVRANDGKVTRQMDTGGSGTVREPVRLYCGLGRDDHVHYVRVLWPDGILQSDRSLVGNQLHTIREVNRKPSSCPILFAWDGGEFAFVGDFLGVGGLGYFEAPGVYNRPDPTEYLLLPALKPKDDGGAKLLALEVIEPLEECTYLDELTLTVVDHPAEVTVIPDEIFAIRAPQPDGFSLLPFRKQWRPQNVIDAAGRNVTAATLKVDRQYANTVERDPRFPGVALTEHRLDMDFGNAVKTILDGAGKDANPYLILHGWVEYGYSTSNFAASQARAPIRAPTLSVERDGKWVPLREEWGFPAGTPRYMAISLRSLLRAEDRRFRLASTMEVYWDQAFLANIEGGDSLRATDLKAVKASLTFRGFPPEESPDGREPYHFVFQDFQELAPFKLFPGAYTRFGDVRELLRARDDEFVIFGPGDGLSLRFATEGLPALPRGWKRTFLLKTTGYCKDMDPYTARSESIDPLPFRSMSAYPYGPGESFPTDADKNVYRANWNQRVVEGTLWDGFDGLTTR